MRTIAGPIWRISVGSSAQLKYAEFSQTVFALTAGVLKGRILKIEGALAPELFDELG